MRLSSCDDVSRTIMIPIQPRPLTSMSNLWGFVVSSCPTRFYLLWHWHTIFVTWGYHNERICRVHSQSWYDFDICPQNQIYRVYDMALCSGHSFFVLWHNYTMFGLWVYYHGTVCRVQSWPQYQNHIFTLTLSLARLSLLFVLVAAQWITDCHKWKTLFVIYEHVILFVTLHFIRFTTTNKKKILVNNSS